jgi:MtrB/PioB family decaheme-associated outer membrane protein
LAVGALPNSSLNGRADTLNANLKLTSAVTDKLRLNAGYVHNDRDNRTAQAAYPSVATDLFVGLPRTNMPYSFKQDKLGLSGEYKVGAKTRAALGYDNDTQKRTFLEADRTHEETAWGKVSSGVTEKIDLSLKLAHSARKNSGYAAAVGVTPLENPLLRKYYMASRKRDTAAFRVDFAALENLNLGLGVDSSRDNYSESIIGLMSGSAFNVNADVTLTLTQQTSVHAFANRETIKSKQAGSQAFGAPDWTGENKDTIDFFGFGVKHAAIKDKLDIGADYAMSRSHGDIDVVTSTVAPAFPTLTTSLDSLKLYASYRVKENITLNAGYWFERYDSKNWMLDGVAPGTIPNFLGFSDQAPKYRVNVVRLSMKYKF